MNFSKVPGKIVSNVWNNQNPNRIWDHKGIKRVRNKLLTISAAVLYLVTTSAEERSNSFSSLSSSDMVVHLFSPCDLWNTQMKWDEEMSKTKTKIKSLSNWVVQENEKLGNW